MLSVAGNLIALVATVLVIFFFYFKWHYQYWTRRSVTQIPPHIPFGNLSKSIKGEEHIAVSLKHIYNAMKGKVPYGGIYVLTKPNFFPLDLDLIKNIMTKDFQYFVDRDRFYNKKDPLQQHLLNLSGSKWRNLRSKLTPAFTSGKMKMMFSVMTECQHDLYKRMDQECLKKEPIDIKEILACFTTNIIGSCAFGLDCQALEDESSDFRKMGRELFLSTRWLRLKRTFFFTFPKLANWLNVSLARRDLVDFFMHIVEDTINYRENNNYTRNDFMQMMINLKNNKPADSSDHDGKPLSMDEVASQCIVFFAAGFETSSTLMSFTLYELAKDQKVQEKLRKEIVSVLHKHEDKITYESIQDMVYLNQVVDESLRLHPPGALLNRKCVKDYKIPNSDLVIEKGTTVTISILGIHHDEEYYPQPEKFDPERFNEENRKNRHHYAHLPFGEGPRNCIGMRFGVLQSKVGLALLLKNYKFTINKKTQEPLAYVPSNIVLSVKGEIWLDAQKA